MREKLYWIFVESLAILPDLWYDITVNIKLIEALLNCGLSVSFVYVLFSPCREKSTKRAPLKESTHGTFLKDPFPLSARHFAYGEMANALLSRSLPWSRTAVRVTTARLAAQFGGKVDCFSERFTSASCP